MGLFLFLITIVWAVVWGYATRKVIENKGYSENWFWWGFAFLLRTNFFSHPQNSGLFKK